MAGETTVSMAALEDFQRTLTRRLEEADALIAKLGTELSGKPPALGKFYDAAEVQINYQNLRSQFLDRARKLRSAIVATQTATATIHANYTSTEALNAASAADIARTLTGVDGALNNGG